MAGRGKGAVLNDKQQRFVEEYPKDLNATRAAKRAGYSERTAHVQGAHLLKNPRIRAAVDAALEARSKRTGITADRVLRELELLAFSDVSHFSADEDGRIVLAEGAPEGAQRALASVKRKTTSYGSEDNERTEHQTEFRLWNKPDMVRLAGRHVGIKGFHERMEHSGPDGGPIPVADLSGLTDAQLKTLRTLAAKVMPE